MNKEQEVRYLERKIIQHGLELDELRYDEKIVKSNYTKGSIDSSIKRIKRRIEQLEFKLWKSTKEEE